MTSYGMKKLERGHAGEYGIRQMDQIILAALTIEAAALNNLSPEIRLEAAKEIIYGQSFQLDWPYEKAGKPAFGRLGLQHKIINYEPITGEMAHDDEISLNTQCGSQWDGFMHYADQKIRSYYNGLQHTDDVALRPEAHGVHYWCKQGIVGRGVLLDWPRWLEATGQAPISPITSHSITVQDLQSIAAYQGLEFHFGDILIIRTGFIAWFEAATAPDKAEVFAKISFSGVQQGEETERWLWDTGFSAVAGDAAILRQKVALCSTSGFFHMRGYRSVSYGTWNH
ncbi:hypothetical protein G7Z17_g2519 [Cylindrodendrum hubeiense]|uniref:Uncharacterized protein n=1 Tax=Cylindrodendrum hubeiense TaxID=595255 RepID=A0A9P5HCR0_9HYPO|nr:hypothetical protein G7Z17_g2519 [Cylindrodendrum hubeiense]